MHAHHKYGFIGLLFMASIQQTPQGPVIVLKESALQQKGKEAQQNNITAAKLVSELVRSSLGPRGLDTSFAAVMLFCCASLPFCCNALSFRTITGPCGVCCIDAMNNNPMNPYL